MLAEHIQPTHRPMPERDSTVGASEIGCCARMVWFRKRGTPEERDTGWGYGERGHVVEAWAVSRLRAAGVPIKDEQRRLTRGFLSATVDLTYEGEPVDIKSFDPRKTRVPEPKNLLQSQVQSGLMGAARGHLLAINASDYSDIRETVVEHDPELFATLQQRARQIMTEGRPPAEGRIAGGFECEWCPFQAACLGEPVTDSGELSVDDKKALEIAVRAAMIADNDADTHKKIAAAARETIRDILRAANVRRAPGLARISRRQNSSLDTEAMTADGIDLSKYRKPSRASETVTLE